MAGSDNWLMELFGEGFLTPATVHHIATTRGRASWTASIRSLVWIAVGIWVMIGGQCAAAVLSL